ncbi:hypothetical protein [Streptomyces sp. 2A115]|uniref:hypothetical protein n=1 Tax=Streptomyces sp. 2A115 TaxID=3457439 RepID=UPI003FD4AF59
MTSAMPAEDRALRAWALAQARSVGRGGGAAEPAVAAHGPSQEVTPGSTALNMELSETEDVTCMDICAVPGGPLLVATGTRTGLVRIWDGQTGRLLRTMPERGVVRFVTWNTHGERALLAVQSDSGTAIWDGLTAALLVRVHGATVRVPAARVRGAGRFLFNRLDSRAHSVIDVWGPDGRYGELRWGRRDAGLLQPDCGVFLPRGRTIAFFTDNSRGRMFAFIADDADGGRSATHHEIPAFPSRISVPAATPVFGDKGFLVAGATESEVTLSDGVLAGPLASLKLADVRALDWLALPGLTLLAAGLGDGRLTVMTVGGGRLLHRRDDSETLEYSHTHSGITRLTWCMTPDREPMVAVLCSDFTVWREQLPFVVPRNRIPPADPRPQKETTVPEASPASPPPPDAPRPTTLRVDPAGLVALGKADLWPPLSLAEDLVALTGRAATDALHDPRFGVLADHPGMARLKDLAWPDRSRVGFVGLLAAGTERIAECEPPPGSRDADRVAALRDALAAGLCASNVPAVSLPPVVAAADTVTDRMISLLTVLGPETVEADPSLPLLLARSAADMPQLDSRQLRLLATQASDGSARTRTTAHAPGTSGTSNRGALTHLLPTQLALPRPLLLLKHSRHELLYRLHVTEAEPLPGEVTLVLDTSPPTFGPVEGLLRAAAHVITAELWRYGRHPHLVTLDQPSQSMPIARPADLLALWTTRTLDVPDVACALKTAAFTGIPALLLTHHRLPRQLGLTPGPQLRLLTTHLADDAPAGRSALPFHQHVPPSPQPAQLWNAISALLTG